MPTNGRLSAKQLTEIEKGQFVSNVTSRAYRRAKAYWFDQGVHMTLAGPGAAYRSYAVQSEFWHAAHGNVALARKWGLNPNSHVAVASAGYSSHGTGDRVDLLFNGSSSPTTEQIRVMAFFGWVREFGAADPNHFQHKGGHGLEAVSTSFLHAHNLFVA
jgi:hypothetical protein